MNSIKVINGFVIPGFIMLLLDSIYLTSTAGYFKRQIMDVQKGPMKLNILGVVLCYLLLIFSLNYFILEPKKSVYEAMILGLVIYGVYETTNYAILKNWKLTTVILDGLWGSILFGLTTYLHIYWFKNKLSPYHR